MAFYKKNGNNNNGDKEKAVDKWKKWEHGRIKATVSVTQPSETNPNPEAKIYLYNLEPEDGAAICAKLKEDGTNTSKAWVNKAEPSNIGIKVKDNDIQSWLDNGDLDRVKFILAKSGKYDAGEIEHLADQIDNGANYGSPKDHMELANKATDTAMQMWQNYLSTVNDPETMKTLMAYDRYFTEIEGLDKLYGHMLSMRNADLIRARKSDATFVLSRYDWEKLNRGIKRGATPLAYWAPAKNGNVSSTDRQNVINKTTWCGNNFSSLPMQARKGVDIRANTEDSTRFMAVIGYDVSDTYLFPNATSDPWAEEAGLLNNLTGELNQGAKDREADFDAKHPKQDPNQNSGQSDMEKKTKLAFDFITANPDKFEDITPKNSGDINKDVADMIFDACLKRTASHAGILNSNNERVYAENATKIVLILEKIATPELNRYNRTYVYDKKEASALMKIVYNLVATLERNISLNEGIMSWISNKAAFIKRFIKALKEIGCKIVSHKSDTENVSETPESINENFYRILNKLG